MKSEIFLPNQKSTIVNQHSSIKPREKAARLEEFIDDVAFCLAVNRLLIERESYEGDFRLFGCWMASYY